MSEPTSPVVPSDSATAEVPIETPEKVIDWEAEAKTWMKRSKDNFAKLKEAEPKLTEYERMVQANKTEDERKNEELARWQSEAEKWRGASVASRIEVLAAGHFADPTDAVAALAEPGKYLDAAGVIDDEAIKADLAEVLVRKPHWSASTTSTTTSTVPRAPWPNPAQGASASGYPVAVTPADTFASLIKAQLK